MAESRTSNQTAAEMRLLWLCCSVKLSSEEADEFLRLSRDKIDWEWILANAIEHRVDGFLFEHLCKMPDGLVPENIGRELRWRRRQIARRNGALATELIALIKRMEEQAVLVVPYKGPILLQQVYGDVGIRATHDIDIMIDSADRGSCESILSSRGYQPVHPATRLGRLIQTALEKDSEWHSPDRDLIVEAHWRFAKWGYPPVIKNFELSSASRPAAWYGQALRTFRAEETLLTLCLHGSIHQWHRLEMLTMVAEFCRVEGGVNWQRLNDVVNPVSGARPLLLGLSLAHRNLKAPVPAELIREGNGNVTVMHLAAQVERIWELQRHEFTLLESMLFELSLLASRRARIRYLVGQLALGILRPFIGARLFSGETLSRPMTLARRHALNLKDLLRVFAKALHTK